MVVFSGVAIYNGIANKFSAEAILTGALLIGLGLILVLMTVASYKRDLVRRIPARERYIYVMVGILFLLIMYAFDTASARIIFSFSVLLFIVVIKTLVRFWRRRTY